MNIKNKKLMGHTGKKPSSDLPSMYKDSKLFARRHPNQEGSQYSKAVELPDEQLEDLEPTEEDKISKTQKAINLLNSVLTTHPDTSGSLEGKFKVSIGEMVSKLNSILKGEYSQWFRYHHYELVLRGPYRDALAAEFAKHAGEELGHASGIAARIIGLGHPPMTAIEEPVHLEDAEEILKELIKREQEGMKLYRDVLALCGENEGTRQLLEGNIAIEQEHIDDLWRYLRNPELVKANFSSGRDTMPSEKHAKKEYEDSFARYPGGISGSSTPDLPERGKDWHDEIDDDKEQKEAQESFKDPVNLLEKPSKHVTKGFNAAAVKALSGAPLFVKGPLVPPAEKRFLVTQGYSEEEIDSGRIKLTPMLRAEYNRWLTGSVRKSMSKISGRWS